MKARAELSVIAKTYDLILWFVPIIGRFPRSHRFVLGERLEGKLYGLLDTLIQAKYHSDRMALLEDANVALETLRFQVRLAKDLELLSLRRYEYVARHIDDIGREIGAWVRQQRIGKKA